jgi:dihydroxy-acid dehydratase
MSLPYSASTPATYPEKIQECFKAAKYLKVLLELDVKPSDILTRASFLNAIVIINVIGGSTNAVLHLLAMARAVNVELTIDDFQRISDKTPYLANLKCVVISPSMVTNMFFAQTVRQVLYGRHSQDRRNTYHFEVFA